MSSLRGTHFDENHIQCNKTFSEASRLVLHHALQEIMLRWLWNSSLAAVNLQRNDLRGNESAEERASPFLLVVVDEENVYGDQADYGMVRPHGHGLDGTSLFCFAILFYHHYQSKKHI